MINSIFLADTLVDDSLTTDSLTTDSLTTDSGAKQENPESSNLAPASTGSSVSGSRHGTLSWQEIESMTLLQLAEKFDCQVSQLLNIQPRSQWLMDHYPNTGVRRPTIYSACAAVAANEGYINKQFSKLGRLDSLKHRICIVGHGRSGKDTAASILAELLGYKIGGSTSFGVIPLVSYALIGCTDIGSQEECYANRHDNRMYWFDFCNLLRQIDPLLLLKLTLADSDFIIGTRSKEEFINSLEYFRPFNVLWIERNVDSDPTLEYSFEFCMQECNKRGIRCTRIGNNDSVEVLEQQLAHMVKSGIIK